MKSNLRKKQPSAENDNFLSRNRLLIIAGLVAIGAAYNSSIAVADNSARPFSANFIGARPIGSDTFAGTGIATHLGKFDLIGHRVIGQPTSSTPCFGFQSLTVTLTAANGDELSLDATGGELCFDLSNLPLSAPFIGEANFVAIGGTGRFSDATGDFQMLWRGDAASAELSFTGELWGVVGY